METNNVIGHLAKAIKFKHGVISSDIATKQAAYQDASSTFASTEDAAETAFLQKYNLDDVEMQGQEEDALEQAETSIKGMYDTIQFKSTTPELIDSLQEFNDQINSERDAFVLNKGQKADALEVSRAAIASEFGVAGDFSVPPIAGYTAAGMQAGLGA